LCGGFFFEYIEKSLNVKVFFGGVFPWVGKETWEDNEKNGSLQGCTEKLIIICTPQIFHKWNIEAFRKSHQTGTRRKAGGKQRRRG
jgi:hypothetical protein